MSLSRGLAEELRGREIQISISNFTEGLAGRVAGIGGLRKEGALGPVDSGRYGINGRGTPGDSVTSGSLNCIQNLCGDQKKYIKGNKRKRAKKSNDSRGT